MNRPKPLDVTHARQVTVPVKTDMDHRLQMLMIQQRSGRTKQATASTGVDEVAVVARVSNGKKWLALGEVRTASIIGETPDGESIVVGRIPVQRIQRVREQPFVLSMKAARPIRPLLAETTGELEAQTHLLPDNHRTSGGKGVVVGVVDYGCDFAHQNFRNGNGSTRVEFLWDQNGPSGPGSPFGYGRDYSAATLNLALGMSNPYQAIGYDPADYEGGQPGTHGTHVMDIAAGNGRGSGVPGVAPNADLIFVNISHEKDPTGIDAVGKSFGDSVTLLEALKYIFDKAGTRPCVVNVSLGTNGGPHDGTTPLDLGIDVLLQAKPNRAVTIAASNSFDDGIHAAGKLTQGGTADLLWDVKTQLFADIEFELWYGGTDRFKVELFAPNGFLLASTEPGESKEAKIDGELAAFVSNRLDEPNNHDNTIGILLAAGMPPGTYTVRLTGISVTAGGYHAWIERDNSFQSSFIPPFDNSHTIGSISCGKNVVAVGSYDAHVSGAPLSWFSSAGPTRDGRKKPEVSAPGHDVWAARSSTGSGVVRKSGTSMAAPAVAGVVALLFESAQAHGRTLTIDQTIQILVAAARRNPPTGMTWHDRYGWGRASASRAIEEMLSLSSSPGGTSNGSSAGTTASVNGRRKKKRATKPSRR